MLNDHIVVFLTALLNTGSISLEELADANTATRLRLSLETLLNDVSMYESCGAWCGKERGRSKTPLINAFTPI